MAENIIINNSTPMGSSNSSSSSTLSTILKYFIYLIIIVLLVAAIVAAYLVVDNWEWLVTTFTTGTLGWLNPFDNDKDDTNPVTGAKEKYIDTPLSLAWWWPGNWF